MRRPPSRPLPPQCLPRLLTPEQEATVRRAIADGYTRDEAAFEAGITPARLWARLRDQLRDVRVGRGRRGRRRDFVDPTPAEIAERAAAIRSRWTPEEEESRRCGGDFNRGPFVE